MQMDFVCCMNFLLMVVECGHDDCNEVSVPAEGWPGLDSKDSNFFCLADSMGESF